MSLREKFIKGSSWLILGFLITKICQLTTQSITTRLLMPEDFGLIAIAMSIIGVLDELTTTGIDSALIQKSKSDALKYMNSAWTIGLIRNLLLFIITVVFAPFFVDLFNRPEALLIVRVAALSYVISGFWNIGIIWYRKNLDFKNHIIYENIPAIINMITAIALVFWLRSVWALVIATLSATIVKVLVSYYMHSFRPKLDFNLKNIFPILSFSIWITLNAIINAIQKQGIIIILSWLLTLDDIGYYNRAEVFSMGIFMSIISYYWQISYPLFSSINNNIKRLYYIWIRSTLLLVIFGFISLSLFFLSAPYIIKLLLIPTWYPIIPLIQINCIIFFFILIAAPSNVLTQSIGYPKLSTFGALINVIVFFVLVFPLTNEYGLKGALYSLLVSNISGAILIIILVSYKISKLLKN